MKFEKANLTIMEVASALKMDPQTVRILCQQSFVPWGTAVKLPGNRRYFYLISPKKFYEETGMLLGV